MRLVIADCEVNYSGRLDAHLPRATRLIMVKADGSVLIHSDGGSYKPLNWMTAPCTLRVDFPVSDPGEDGAAAGEGQVTEVGCPGEDGAHTQAVTVPADLEPGTETETATQDLEPVQTWTVSTKKNESLVIDIFHVYSDVSRDLGVDPGVEKDGVEAHLQKLLAEQVEPVLGPGWSLVRREWPTPIGPVDLLVRDAQGRPVAVEVKRRGEIDGVEQLSRYLELLGRQTGLESITGIFAAQEIKPQARTLAEDRGIRCVVLHYDQMRGLDLDPNRLF